MLKVLKFGGSSMADAHQLEKVRSIVEADPARRVVVVSAAGKRFKDDHKITDLLYLCHAHLQYGVSCDGIFDMVRSRYLEIRDELGLSTPLEAEFDALRAKMDKGISADELVSRGEYFAARIMADCLGFDFLDSSLWLHFRMDGTVDQEASYQALVHAASGRKVVIPGFYGVLPDGSIHTFSRGGSDITGALAAAALAVCLCGGQLRNYEKLVSDQLDGTQDAYIAQFQREYALCEAAGAADDVVLPAWTVQTVTGKPTAYEDAAFWTNEAMAQYFGVKSVRVE